MTAQLFASGEGWVGSGIQSIESGLHSLFKGARRRIVACTYAISGAAFDLPAQWLGTAIGRGVEIIMVVNRCSDRNRLGLDPLVQIARDSDALKLFDYTGADFHDLHAKAVVADEKVALIGSSNWSRNGLLRNHELAVWVEGEPARLASSLILKLTASTHAHRLL